MIDVRKKVIRVKIISLSQRKLLITALPLPEYATDQNGLDEKQMRVAAKNICNTHFRDKFVTNE